MLYPLLMRPYYRHSEQTPWGGSSLREIFGKEIPSDFTGESLEISALPGLSSLVVNGEWAGKTLDEVFASWGAELTGLADEKFPHVVKLLDARDMLSVQVHPGDAYAMPKCGKPGKTEAWAILAARPGAKIVYGLEKSEHFEKAAREGRLEDFIHWQEVYPGDVYEIPNGLLHALGSGIVAYEIQQNSDVTYRFWDFGRMGLDGKPRELHVDDALNVIRPEVRPQKVKGATYLTAGGSVTAFISNTYFELSRINLAGKMPLASGRMRALTPLNECAVTYPGGEVRVKAGETILVPAGLMEVAIVGRGSVMCSAPPDPKALIDEHSSRASDVAGLLGEEFS